jgi:cytochrome c-type biogenesis protein CcmH
MGELRAHDRRSHRGTLRWVSSVVSVASVFHALVFALLSTLALAQTEAKGPEEARVKALAEELRCLVCQNQTIADSNAPLAQDLRNQIRGQIAQGRSDDQIRGYMVERYGDFVLYRPPFKLTTALLWLGPVLMILGGAVVFWRVVRRKRTAAPAMPVPRERRRQIEELLGKD